VLAAVPGDPFKLGRINTIGKITQLVSSADSAMLKIDNGSVLFPLRAPILSPFDPNSGISGANVH
jgi:hypothetical protein